MRAFDYARPGNLADVFGLLDEYGSGATVLAGGTDLMVRFRAGRTPKMVVDLKRVAALRADIADHGTHLRIGALTNMTTILADARVRRHFPALIEAARVVGSVQIRNRATLAGNICNASPAADTAPALLVYGAGVNLVSRRGARMVPLGEFFTGPGRTVMGPGEIVESIDLPIPSEPTGSAFGRLTRRRGVDLATVNLCCLVKQSGETLLAFGAVGPRPFVARDDSGMLGDPGAGAREKDLALQRIIALASPISDVRGSREYRLAMLSVLSRRALAAATARLGGQ